MYFCTTASFGHFAATILAVFATVAFWFLMRNEQSRLIKQELTDEIRAAILEAGDIESFIEVKRIKQGIIARIYLINAREKAVMAQRSVARKLENCEFKKYLWVMQMTDMPGMGALRETQQMLNEQLLKELTARKFRNEK
jgi:hypothetical protein